MEVTVEHLGSVQFEIRARGHFVVSDQPIANGGFDEGMTPPEFLLAALGSCVGFYAAQYLRKHKLATAGTRVRVSCEKVNDPMPRLTDFVVQLDAPVEFTERHRAGVQEAVENCLVHNTLRHSPQITLQIASPVAVNA
jgi:putative redox protein